MNTIHFLEILSQDQSKEILPQEQSKEILFQELKEGIKQLEDDLYKKIGFPQKQDQSKDNC